MVRWSVGKVRINSQNHIIKRLLEVESSRKVLVISQEVLSYILGIDDAPTAQAYNDPKFRVDDQSETFQKRGLNSHSVYSGGVPRFFFAAWNE